MDQFVFKQYRIEADEHVTELPEFDGTKAKELFSEVPPDYIEPPETLTNPPKLLPERFTKVGSSPRYLIESRSMAGGVSEVHKAWHTKLQKLVCVKKVLEEYKEDNHLANVSEEEAKIMARLRHPNIPEIYDFIQGDDERYMVMQYIKGDSLKSITDSHTRITRDDLVDIVQQLASVIDYLPTQKDLPLYHFDIKPNNIILS